MKKCSKCKEEKSLSSFGKKNDKLQTFCIECNKAYHRDHYQRNKKEYSEKFKARKQDLKKWWTEFRVGSGCSKCTENHPAVLDCHHLDPKEKEHNLSQMVAEGFSKESIMEEMSKCIILCKNCHAKVHFEMKHGVIF